MSPLIREKDLDRKKFGNHILLYYPDRFFHCGRLGEHLSQDIPLIFPARIQYFQTGRELHLPGTLQGCKSYIISQPLIVHSSLGIMLYHRRLMGGIGVARVMRRLHVEITVFSIRRGNKSFYGIRISLIFVVP